MTFSDAFAYTMRHEGGATVTRDPDDPGGTTKWGISQRAYPMLDIPSLTEDEAKTIYERDYWKAYGLDKLTNEKIAIKVFDAVVNMGSRALAFAQTAVNLAGYEPQLFIDRKMGPKTIKALNEVDYTAWSYRMVLLLSEYYLSLNKPKYEKGWLKRAETLP